MSLVYVGDLRVQKVEMKYPLILPMVPFLFLHHEVGRHYDGTATTLSGWEEGRRQRLGFAFERRHYDGTTAVGWLGGRKTTPSRFCLRTSALRQQWVTGWREDNTV
ncbi:hypothetical protein LR48_Vigan06g116300 [Vigna angularis]|uniref:Uncharacterized protein n=1 Tax=Phaseolus angularis TaxID=3914 RepID=A0A0L9UTE3_PHAAN|nr:hypothetical protein LR48_Vigan06g116300 [Vigna angularis]